MQTSWFFLALASASAIATSMEATLCHSVDDISGNFQGDTGQAATGLATDQLPKMQEGKAVIEPSKKQNLTSSVETSISLTTTVFTHVVTVEVPSRTEVFVSTLRRTLTFISPVLVTRTSVVTVLPSPEVGVKRDVASSTASTGSEATLSAQYNHPQGSIPSAGMIAPAPTHPAAVRRQVSNESSLLPGRVSTVTIETTITLTRTGSFVSTATVLNPTYVSVTARPILTTIELVTVTAPIETTLQTSRVVATTDTDKSVDTTSPPTTAFGPTASSETSSEDTSTPSASTTRAVLTGTGAVSTLPDSTVDVTTWSGTPTTTEPTWIDTTIWFVDPPSSTPSQISTDPSSPSSASPSPTQFPSDPGLSADAIAGIAVGTFSAVTLVIFAIWFFRKRAKLREHESLSDDAYQMTPAAAAAAIIDSLPSNPSITNQPNAFPARDLSGDSSVDDGVRYVIRPPPDRRTQSGNLYPAPLRTWPKPPGYHGQAYSFSAGESGNTTPRDPREWSAASDYGSSSNQEDQRGAGGRGPVSGRGLEGTEPWPRL
ncbi:hypothetical protein CSOJ01_02983 [Colletotrichum sojae]|uniref:Transmembrane protein n=1 Tax=Colletotrichum sojae TaxID=2175907 RepID=A0A8H6JPC6_9PEZI|nr:hypothetical protein CSOJ01_02983 [Colletotrichum sojae]